MHRAPRATQRGLTLIEVMIGTLIAIFLTSAAVIFASHETKLLGFSTEQIEMQQSARTAIDLLARDLELAGAGVGYINCSPATCTPRTDGNPATGPRFAGLQTGRFNALGPGGSAGLVFNDQGSVAAPFPNPIHQVALRGATSGNALSAAVNVPTHDLGILMADEQRVTIAAHNPGTNLGEICDATNALPASPIRLYALMRDETLISGRSTLLEVTSNAALGNCTYGACAPNIAAGGEGCRTVRFVNDPWPVAQQFNSDTAAAVLNYSGGEAAIGYKQVVWWVENDAIPADSHRANLRRGEFGFNSVTGAEQACPVGGRGTCGGEVAYNVETLHYQVWRFNPNGPASLDPTQDFRWQRVPSGPIDGFFPADPTNPRPRLRVDVELVVRARVADERVHPGIRMTVPGFCLPGWTPMDVNPTVPCPNRDNVERRVHRISVDIKNSGR